MSGFESTESLETHRIAWNFEYFCYPSSYPIYLSFKAREDSTEYLIWLTGGLIGWYFLHRRTKAAERDATASELSAKVEEQRVKIDEQRAKITEQGMAFEQLTSAIQRLASDNSAIRLDGIFGLEQIAESQEGERNKIVQILSTRICELAPRDDSKTVEDRHKRSDIESALEILARIAKPFLRRKRFLCELLSVDLTKLRFSGIDLSYFDLRDSNLSNAFFYETNFTGTDLTNVNLSRSHLGRSDFNRAYLRGANLNGAYLNDTNFVRTFLSRANLKGADFSGSNLNRAFLIRSNFDNTNLEEVNISGANFKLAEGLTQEQIDKSFYWQGHPPRNLPDGLKPPQERNPDEGEKLPF